MGKNRLEAFSDGVLAIIITIMILEIKIPHGDELISLRPLIPKLISYILSFTYIGIYWNNHHHLFHTVEKVSGTIMWLNMALLFSLSLLPFATDWMGENHFTQWPVVVYGVTLIIPGITYYLLSQSIIALHGKDSVLAKAVGKDIKGILSLVLYLIGIGLSFVHPMLGFVIYVLVAMMWFIPDRRIERIQAK